MILHSEEDVRAWLTDEIGCDDLALAKLERLVAMLAEENHRQNLVSAGSLDRAWVRHIADSAQLLSVSRGTPTNWWDLGSGAGFPGLVIVICRPRLAVTLVESRSRRIEWLGRAAKALELNNAFILGRRLEHVPNSPVDVISARAFAPLRRLIELSARFSTAHTQWLLPKGQNGVQELQTMPAKIQKMFHVEPSLTDPDSVILVGTGAIAPPRKQT